ncbi:MAG: MFS transporter [Gammaproteobacteria bacterium]|nr:MFS transporter [Gammaproteobacteria bacterium]
MVLQPPETPQLSFRSIVEHYPALAWFLAARFLSATAIQAQNVAIGWLVYDLTRDPLALGIVGLLTFLPAVLLALVTGHVADRYDRRVVMVISYLLTAVTAGGFWFAARDPGTPISVVYALVLAFGATRAFANPAGQALLPNLVPAGELARAVSLGSITWQIATIAGPAAGGLLYAFAGTGVFATVAGAFVVTACLFLAVRPRAGRAARQPHEEGLLAGLRFVRSNRVIFGAISLDLFAVLLGGATALMPVYARDILDVGPEGLGLLRSAPSVGALAAAAALTRWPLERRAGVRMFQGVAVFGLATIGFGVSTSLWLSLAFLCVLGAADMVSVVVRQTLVQLETPDAMRGRVSAVNSVFIGASNELGEFESGVAAALVGTVPAVVIGGVGTLAVAALWARWFPELRERDGLVR